MNLLRVLALSTASLLMDSAISSLFKPFTSCVCLKFYNSCKPGISSKIRMVRSRLIYRAPNWKLSYWVLSNLSDCTKDSKLPFRSSWARFVTYPNKIGGNFAIVEVNRPPCCSESGQCGLNDADLTHLVLVGGKLVLLKVHQPVLLKLRQSNYDVVHGYGNHPQPSH